MAFFAALAVVLWRVDPPLLVLLAGPLAALTLYQRSALASKIARRDAHTDSLTGLGNHRAYELALGDLLDRAGCRRDAARPRLRGHRRLQVDQRHATAIRPATRCSSSSARSSTAAAPRGTFRFGGDEFALAYTIDAEAVAAELQDILDAVGDGRSHGVGRVGISLGACTHVEGSAPRSSSGAPTRALYWSKRQGKNRWCLYDPAIVREPSHEEHRLRGEPPRPAAGGGAPDPRRRRARPLHGATLPVGRAAGPAAIAAELGFDEQTVEQVRLAGLLHDLGKVARPRLRS